MEQTPAPRPWQRLMDQCSSSGGVFTTPQATALGIDKKQLQRQLSKGLLVREQHGVYRLAACPLGLVERARAAPMRTGGVASHETAAQLWGFEGFETTPVHITVRHGVRRSRSSSVVVHTTRREVTQFAAHRQGVTLTQPLLTVLDLSGQDIADQKVRDFLAHCVAHGLLTVRGLDRFVALNGKRMPGIVRLREVLSSLDEVDSVAEAELVALLVGAGIPRPVTRFVIRDGTRFVARVDLAWPDLCIAMEIDGYRYHSDVRTFVSDRERGNRIVGCGWSLLRTTPTAVRRRPHMVISHVETAMRRPPAVPGPRLLPATG